MVGLALLSLAPAGSRALPLERHRLPLDGDGLVNQESPTVAPAGRWSSGLWLGDATRPLVLRRPNGEVAGVLVPQRIGGGLLLSRAWADRFALGLELPLVLRQTTEAPLAAATGGTGDLTLHGKLRLWGDTSTQLAAAATLSVSVPTAASGLGETGVTLRPGVVAGARSGRWRTAASLELLLRSEATLFGVRFGNEWHGTVGAGWRLFDDGEPQLEWSASASAFSSFDLGQRGGELRTQLSWRPTDTLMFGLGAGAGVGPLIGTPESRVFLVVRSEFAPSPRVAPPEPIPVEQPSLPVDDGLPAEAP